MIPSKFKISALTQLLPCSHSFLDLVGDRLHHTLHTLMQSIQRIVPSHGLRVV